jgi:competence protein ComEC
MSLMAWYYGRAFHPFVLLPLAAAITVIMQPSYVWGDLGWQLSFAAFAGVMIVAPLVQRYFFGEKEPGVFRQVFGETIAAHLVTVPIIALSFGTISHVAIIANLLVVPLVPLAMLLTFIVGILAIANVPLSMLIAEPASWLLGYMVTVARFVSELEWAQSELTIPSWWWIVYVALIGGMCVWIWKVTRFRFGATEPLY